MPSYLLCDCFSPWSYCSADSGLLFCAIRLVVKLKIVLSASLKSSKHFPSGSQVKTCRSTLLCDIVQRQLFFLRTRKGEAATTETFRHIVVISLIWLFQCFPPSKCLYPLGILCIIWILGSNGLGRSANKVSAKLYKIIVFKRSFFFPLLKSQKGLTAHKIEFCLPCKARAAIAIIRDSLVRMEK